MGVKKKSFCGSFSNDKPCLHVDLGKYRDANIEAAENLIGSQYLTLNNSIQDPSYIRHPSATSCSNWPGCRIHGATSPGYS